MQMQEKESMMMQREMMMGPAGKAGAGAAGAEGKEKAEGEKGEKGKQKGPLFKVVDIGKPIDLIAPSKEGAKE